MSALSLAGQMAAQLPQPVQSKGLTRTVKVYSSAPFPIIGLPIKPAGAAATSSFVMAKGRMQACGQTKEHWLH
ncbi:hypothetical protein SDC9_135356 [bioreactor metagenome]|uniref:Uncharacterized protein n=1 Tax=bioreactor metagenome TaxID=1076179 RepID=A0A645DGA9_9ZZZZ